LKRIPRVIAALDVETRAEATGLVSNLAGVIDFFKIGSRLFTAEGPEMVRELNASGAEIFLDLKFHDIPATVAGSVRAATGLGVRMLTMHASGGIDMMKAAASAAAEAAQGFGTKRPLLVGVTMLTSLSIEDVSAIVPFEGPVSDLVVRLAENARKAGLDGVVASVEETSLIKKHFGDDFIVVTPGIRPAGTEVGDQKRVSTPRAAAAAGSDYLVVGRPIIRASSPVSAAEAILAELKAD
jgi:orotidine-5'-phosphate decarboxylase